MGPAQLDGGGAAIDRDRLPRELQRADGLIELLDPGGLVGDVDGGAVDADAAGDDVAGLAVPGEEAVVAVVTLEAVAGEQAALEVVVAGAAGELEMHRRRGPEHAAAGDVVGAVEAVDTHDARRGGHLHGRLAGPAEERQDAALRAGSVAAHDADGVGLLGAGDVEDVLAVGQHRGLDLRRVAAAGRAAAEATALLGDDEVVLAGGADEQDARRVGAAGDLAVRAVT